MAKTKAKLYCYSNISRYKMDIRQLKGLKSQGYKVLYRNFEQEYFIPRKESYEVLLETIRQTPLEEDEIMDISSAIENYTAYAEFLTYIRVVYKKDG